MREYAELQLCIREKLVAEAKTLLERAQVADDAASKANAEASFLFKTANNSRRPISEIDLRELLPEEAVSYLQYRLRIARQHNISNVTIILGRKDSERDTRRRLRPAVEEYLERLHLTCSKMFPFDGRLNLKIKSFDSIFSKQFL